ncbi:MAG: LytTR family transcriptional regulator [Cytophagaceae bacterium]|nr:LytTR family transcriptional regulator [Cytophagaceae bacterium]MBK9935279.1 LytTR family transcriptional regulator [Cytophagaceae bacterium]MBL0301723.1 LytTR family transcriptional regulator [Cytophagaceae bacterium]MBL0324547.1 LytTR family transcriptional regulator [Cytophagaceae bacterium]
MNCSEIQYLEASANYTIFHFNDGRKQMQSYTLKHFEKILQTHKAFSRIHRRYLVNRRHVISYTEFEVLLQNGKRLPVSRRRSFEPNTE